MELIRQEGASFRLGKEYLLITYLSFPFHFGWSLSRNQELDDFISLKMTSAKTKISCLQTYDPHVDDR